MLAVHMLCNICAFCRFALNLIILSCDERDLSGAVREAVEVLEAPENRKILELVRAECMCFFAKYHIIPRDPRFCLSFPVYLCLVVTVCF